MTPFAQAWAERAGQAIGREYAGVRSGPDGPRVLQLIPLRDRGMRAVMRRLGVVATDGE